MKHFKGFTYFLVRFNGDKHWTLKRGDEVIGRFYTEREVKQAILGMVQEG